MFATRRVNAKKKEPLTSTTVAKTVTQRNPTR